MKHLYLSIQRFLRDGEGVTAIEYGLIAAMIAVAVIVTVFLVAQQLETTYVKVKDCILTPSTCK